MQNVVFLGGSIDPKPENTGTWHLAMIDLFGEIKSDEEVVLLCPRREAWNQETKISVDDPNYRNQRVWEIDALENCSFSVFYLDPTTKNDSTMFRLGLVIGRCENAIVHCPKEHRNRAEIEVYARLYKNLTLVDTVEELKAKLAKCFN